jgi:multicomponent K+:H+ antiporter subunit D
VFAILTKVGVYAVLRLWTLCFPADAGASAGFGGTVLIWGGIATLAFGAVGMLASQQMARLAAFSVIASSGTLIATIGFDAPALSSGALFYLGSSTLAGCAMFLLVELLERARQAANDPADIDDGNGALPSFLDADTPLGTNLDDDQQALVGRAIPAGLAFLGVTFTVCALVTAGQPPLSGFVAKLAMLTALLELRTPAAWTLFALLIVSGLCAAVSLMRVGMRHFWAADRPPPRLRVIETLPIAGLLAGAVAMALHAGVVLDYTRTAGDALHSPQLYIDAVMSAQPLPQPAGSAP